MSLDTNWLMDTGASHHIASDLSQLSLHSPYNGANTIVIGNGTGHQIIHTGSISLPNQSRSFKLDNVLCVPTMQKNLISVHQFCNTNRISIEFFPDIFQVKDLATGAPLLQGPIKDCTYEWPNASLPHAFSDFQ